MLSLVNWASWTLVRTGNIEKWFDSVGRNFLLNSDRQSVKWWVVLRRKLFKWRAFRQAGTIHFFYFAYGCFRILSVVLACFFYGQTVFNSRFYYCVSRWYCWSRISRFFGVEHAQNFLLNQDRQSLKRCGESEKRFLHNITAPKPSSKSVQD